MTFQHFAKDFLMEQMRAETDCFYWKKAIYKITSNGFVWRAKLEPQNFGYVALEYGAFPLIAPLNDCVDDEMRTGFGTSDAAFMLWKKNNTRSSDVFWPYSFIKRGDCCSLPTQKLLAEMLQEVVIPYFHATTSIASYLDYMVQFAQSCQPPIGQENIPLDLKCANYFGMDEFVTACCYLGKYSCALNLIQKQRNSMLDQLEDSFSDQSSLPQQSRMSEERYRLIKKDYQNYQRTIEEAMWHGKAACTDYFQSVYERNRCAIQAVWNVVLPEDWISWIT